VESYQAKVLDLGAPAHSSPLSRYVQETITLPGAGNNGETIQFERAGPRSLLYFRPGETKAAIVTCGGLCPGVNDVVRSVFLEMHFRYGVRDIMGIRFGYAGLDPANGFEPVRIDAGMVEDIHRNGGSILGTSRGPVDPKVALDYLQQHGIDILFCVGGDGTLRGAHHLHLEAQSRQYNLAVIGIPKTIDNDIPYVWRSFGYQTAIDEAVRVIGAAHNEARSHFNGIGLVKLMGRDAGFIAAGATVASQEVNYALVPEIPFQLDGERGFLLDLMQRIKRRRHAVIVVAEGAGQNLMNSGPLSQDLSGNRSHRDIGCFLRDEIQRYFKAEGVPLTLKYFDPSYLIRSRPANCDDSLLCSQFGRNAVHAAMAGKTDVVIGLWYNAFVHVPIPNTIAAKRRMAPNGELWSAVLAATGQPACFESSIEQESL
jgi:6-phosphofructokinase 1